MKAFVPVWTPRFELGLCASLPYAACARAPLSFALPLHYSVGVRKLDIITASSRSFTGATRHTLHSLSAIRQSVESKED